MARIENATFESLEHNYRQKSTANSVFFDEKNEHFTKDFKRARQIRKEYLDKAQEAHTKNTGRKVQKSIIKNYSCVISCTKETTPQEIYDSVGKYLKDSLGTEIYDIAIHKDEGYLVSKTELDENGNGRKYMSGSDFWQKDGIYYKDELCTKILAKNFDELKENFEIVKNYHAHIEFAGLRKKDGSSIRKAKFDDRKLKRHEWEFNALDKGFLKDFPQKCYELLNNELERQGKEGVKMEFDSQKPKQKRVKGIKHLTSLQEKAKFEGWEALSQKEFKTLQTLEKQANTAGLEAYEVAKKWNKSRVKEIVNFYRDEFDAKYKDIALEFKQDFFREFTNLSKIFNPKENSEDALRALIEQMDNDFNEKLNLLDENFALRDEKNFWLDKASQSINSQLKQIENKAISLDERKAILLDLERFESDYFDKFKQELYYNNEKFADKLNQLNLLLLNEPNDELLNIKKQN